MARTARTAQKDNAVEIPLVTQAEIADRAYELYELRGRVDGADFGDWLQAENWLQAERDLLRRVTTKAAESELELS